MTRNIVKPDRTTLYVRAVMGVGSLVALMGSAYHFGGWWGVSLALGASVTMQIAINQAVDQLRRGG